jgi:hypothetical protein
MDGGEFAALATRPAPARALSSDNARRILRTQPHSAAATAAHQIEDRSMPVQITGIVPHNRSTLGAPRPGSEFDI